MAASPHQQLLARDTGKNAHDNLQLAVQRSPSEAAYWHYLLHAQELQSLCLHELEHVQEPIVAGGRQSLPKAQPLDEGRLNANNLLRR